MNADGIVSLEPPGCFADEAMVYGGVVVIVDDDFVVDDVAEM